MAVAPVPLSVVAREWGRLGLVGFGGPPAHVALLRELTVERRGWLSSQEFEDANAACGLLPGPASTQLAIYCAQRVAGLPGALLGGLAFIVPGLLMILAISAVALTEDPAAWIAGIGAGAGAAVVAVIVAAGVTLVRTSVGGAPPGRRQRAVAYLLAGALAAVFAGVGVVLVLLACGLLELAWQRWRRRRAAAAALHAWPALVLAAGAAELPALAWTALKVGLLSYGGGFVIIPLMQADAVDAYDWMTRLEFANAVAYGQLTPGPVVQTVAAVGWAAAGLGGGLVAAVVAFAPSFVLVGLLGPRFAGLRESPRARGFLDGAGPAGVGAIVGAAVPLAAALEEPWQFTVLAAAALWLALGRPALWALLGGALAGLLLALAGAAPPAG